MGNDNFVVFFFFFLNKKIFLSDLALINHHNFVGFFLNIFFIFWVFLFYFFGSDGPPYFTTFNKDFRVHKVIHFYITHFLFFYIFITWNHKSKLLTSKILLALYMKYYHRDGRRTSDVCTFDTAHHGSDQSNSIGKRFGVHTFSLPSISMVLPSISLSDNMIMLFF